MYDNDGLFISRSELSGGSPENYEGIVIGSNEVYVGVGDQYSNFTHSTEITPGVWHHVVATFSTTATTLYYDGVKTTAGGSVSNNNMNPIWNLGSDHPSEPRIPNATFDEVAVWNHVITDQQAATLYNNGAGVKQTLGDSFATNRVMLWHLDETSGTSASAVQGPGGTASDGNGSWVQGIIPE